MPEEHQEAWQLDEAEEVFDVIFPSRDQVAVVLHPGQDSLDSPSAPITAQRSAVLGLLFAIGSVGSDHLYAIFLGQRLIERVRVVSLVTNQPFGQLVEEASGQNSFHKFALGRRSAFDSDGSRKTVTRGVATIFVPLPRLVGPTAKPLFGRLRK